MDLDAAGAAIASAEAAPEGATDSGPELEARPVLPSLQKTAIGTRHPDGSVSVGRREPARCLLYGPFWRLAQGRYRLGFRCSARQAHRPTEPVLGIEIIALNRLQQAWRDFTPAELASGGGYVEFDVPPALSVDAGDLTRFEFRFLHLGNADLTVSAVELYRLDRYDPAPLPGSRWRLLGRLERVLFGRRRDGAFRVRRLEPPGCVLRGGRPYVQLAEGRYRVTLQCRSGAPRFAGQPVIGIEAVGLRGRFPWTWRQAYLLESPAQDRLPLAWADFTAEELAAGAVTFDLDVPLAVSVETGDAPWLEFKVFHFGNADLEIAALDLQRCGDADPDAAPRRRWRLLGRIGRQIGANGELAARRGDRPGRLTVRPFPAVDIPAGQYRLRLGCRVESETAADRPVLAVQIGIATRRPRWREAPQPVAERHFTAADLKSGGGTLDFTLAPEGSVQGARLDVQLRHVGNADVALADVEIHGIAASSEESGRSCGALPARRRKVLIIGNCQAETIAEAFRRAAPLRRRFDANYQFVGLQKGLQEAGRRLLEQADLLLVQDIKDWDAYPLRQYIPDAIETIEFPFLRFASLWPFDGYGGVNDIEAHQREWPDLTFIYLDGLLGRLRREIPDKEARFQAYRSLDVPGVVNYVRLHDFERRHLQALDRKFGCEVGRFILDNFRQRQLFYAINHPNAEIFKVLLEGIMRRLGIDEPFVAPLEHIDVVQRVQVPVHPQVARALGVGWADEGTVYAYEGRQIVWEQWVRAYIDHYG